MVRHIFFFVAFVFLLSNWAFAQQGFGRFDNSSENKFKPKTTSEIAHFSGSKVLKFSLPGNSCKGFDCRHDRERSQLIQSRPDNREGRAYRYTISIFMPNNMPSVSPTNLMLWEIKSFESLRPSIAVEVDGNRLRFILSDPNNEQKDPMHPIKPIVIKTITSSARGKWLDFVMDARWSREEDGYVRLYLNGRQVVNHSGPNLDSKSKKQALMFGLYRGFISRYMVAKGASELPLQEAYFANITRSRLD